MKIAKSNIFLLSLVHTMTLFALYWSQNVSLLDKSMNSGRFGREAEAQVPIGHFIDTKIPKKCLSVFGGLYKMKGGQSLYLCL